VIHSKLFLLKKLNLITLIDRYPKATIKMDFLFLYYP
jgi:hypothetical protein